MCVSLNAQFSPHPPLGYAQHLGGAGGGRAERRSCAGSSLPPPALQPPDTCPLLPKAGLSTRHLALLTSTICQGLTRTFLHFLPHLPPGNSSAVLPRAGTASHHLPALLPQNTLLLGWEISCSWLILCLVHETLSLNLMCCRSVLE